MKNNVEKVVRSRAFLLHFLPTGMVFVTLIAATIWGWAAAVDARDTEQERVVRSEAAAVERSITNRFDIYGENLRGAAGIFSASGDVTRSEWRDYVDKTNLDDRLPGIRGIGYAPYVRPGSEAAYIDTVRAEEGYGDYSINPLPTDGQTPSVPIQYIEPLEPATRSALGYNMFSNAVRRATMEKARDTGQPTLTPKIDLVNRLSPDQNRPGFILYAPVFTNGVPTATIDERRAAIKGFAYMSFRADELFDAVFSQGIDNVGFEIYSAATTQDNLLFRSANYAQFSSADNSLEYTSDFRLDEQPLTIRYSLSPAIINAVINDRPIGLLISGLLASLLISGLVLVLLIGRTRSLAAIKEHELQAAKDDLLSLASHQLRTPATGVKQYLGMIMEGYAGKIPASQKEYLQKAYDSNERQLSIINELLYVAKADAGRIVLTRRDINLNAMLESMVGEQRGTAGDKSITLSLSVPKKPITIYADMHSMHMAIENLINNAIKYTPEGGSVSIGARRAPGEIRVYVRDTGVGIPADKIDTVFKQFARVDNELSASAGGSGIGLYLSRHLIELHGGSIDVSSRVGRGSVFTAHLPNESASDIIKQRVTSSAPRRKDTAPDQSDTHDN